MKKDESLEGLKKKLGIEEELDGGYSRHQMELMSVPSEYLEEAAQEYEKKILEERV